MSFAPLIWAWDGEFMRPLRRMARLADKQFVIGEHYRMTVEEERSANSERHYFAMIDEAWKNLPEGLIEEHPTPERLRKWALVKAGFRSERSIVCSTSEDAYRMAAFVRGFDEYAVVLVSENVVRVLTAKSQSRTDMKREEFGRSKDAVLDILANLIEATRTDLSDAAQGNAA